jgi:tRNA(Ile)-lysidine synthase
LRAVHFDHGLRAAESDADAAFCSSFCQRHGVPFALERLDVPAKLLPGEGVEAAARRLRLERWFALGSGPTKAVALGHHAGDRAENLLLRLFRGSNASGLSSLRGVQIIGGVLFVRPLLEASRAELESFLKERGEAWRSDSSNSDEAYKRNFLRHTLLPEIANSFPYASAGLAQSLRALQDDASLLETLAAKEFAKFAGQDAAPAVWLALPPALRIRVLRLWLTSRLGFDFVPDSHLFERFNAELAHASSERCLLPLREGAGTLNICSKGVALLQAAPSERRWLWRSEPSIRWGSFELEARLCSAFELPKDNWSALFDASALSEELLLSSWREGERMTPFGRKSPALLKELFNKAGVSSCERVAHPVLRLPSGEPLWLPGVKRSSLALAGASARTLLELRAKKL